MISLGKVLINRCWRRCLNSVSWVGVCVFPPTYYLYRAFKFVMLMTPCVSMQEGAREELNGAAAWLKMHLRGHVEVLMLTGVPIEPADDAAESDLMEVICSFYYGLVWAPCWGFKGTALTNEETKQRVGSMLQQTRRFSWRQDAQVNQRVQSPKKQTKNALIRSVMLKCSRLWKICRTQPRKFASRKQEKLLFWLQKPQM